MKVIVKARLITDEKNEKELGEPIIIPPFKCDIYIKIPHGKFKYEIKDGKGKTEGFIFRLDVKNSIDGLLVPYYKFKDCNIPASLIITSDDNKTLEKNSEIEVNFLTPPTLEEAIQDAENNH